MKNNNIKIGILTLSASDNCGSLLQTFALQKAIFKLGYENVEVIDFQSELSQKAYDIFPKDIILQPRKFLSTLLHYQKLKKQKMEYNRFRNSKIIFSSEKYFTIKDIRTLGDKYDIVVCGSDQIWNIKMYDFSEAFFLPEVKNIRKIAYAASLGGQKLRKYKDLKSLEKWINDFDKISVREIDGRKEIMSLYNKDVDVLADPTLLLNKEEWKEIAGENRIIRENYIFYYSWSYKDERLIQIVQQISSQLKKPVYVINASKWLIHSYKKFGFYLCEEGGPFAFTNLIRFADLVLVESLHGSIFSTIYEKEFWYLNGCDNGIDQRNEYFLNLLGMSERVINADQRIDENTIQKGIAYTQNDTIEKLIQTSQNWLGESIKISK